MSSKSKNTQLLVAGLVAAATVSLVLYFATSSSKATVPSKKKKLDDDNSTKKSSNRSIDVTPKKSNRSDVDEKEMHAKIEELDKKGKALFKNKQVGRVALVRRNLKMTKNMKFSPTKFLSSF
jgi:hypothetical protein